MRMTHMLRKVAEAARDNAGAARDNAAAALDSASALMQKSARALRTQSQPVRRTSESAASPGTAHDRAAAARAAAAEEFKGHARVFQGLYEPLHLACESDDTEACADLLAEWRARAVAEELRAISDAIGEEISGADVLELARRWYGILTTEWGIRRDGSTEFTIDPDDQGQRRRYQITGARAPGARARVQFPCWMYQQTVLERGVATVEPDQQEGGSTMAMSSHPDWEWNDQVADSTDRPAEGAEGTDVPGSGEVSTDGIELPRSHTDMLTHEEGMTPLDLGQRVYDSPEMFGPGLRQEWERIAGPGEDPAHAFSGCYASYILSPEALHEQRPGQYGFIRDHVFHGLEFAAPAGQETARLAFTGQEPAKLAYLDTDSLGRQIEVTSNGTWVVATGQQIA